MKHVATMRLEQRSVERREITLETIITDNGEQAATVLVDDISALGFRMVAAVPLTQGDIVTIEMPRIGQHRATVVWQEGVKFGCTFTVPITAADLTQIVEAGAVRHALQRERAFRGWRPDAAALAA